MRTPLDPKAWASPLPDAASAPPVTLTYADQTLANVMRQRLLDRMTAVQVSILSGALANMEDYRSSIGLLQGLRAAMSELDTASRYASDAPEEQPKADPLYKA